MAGVSVSSAVGRESSSVFATTVPAQASAAAANLVAAVNARELSDSARSSALAKLQVSQKKIGPKFDFNNIYPGRFHRQNCCYRRLPPYGGVPGKDLKLKKTCEKFILFFNIFINHLRKPPWLPLR